MQPVKLRTNVTIKAHGLVIILLPLIATLLLWLNNKTVPLSKLSVRRNKSLSLSMKRVVFVGTNL